MQLGKVTWEESPGVSQSKGPSVLGCRLACDGLDLKSLLRGKFSLARGVPSQDSFSGNLVLVYKSGPLLMYIGV